MIIDKQVGSAIVAGLVALAGCDYGLPLPRGGAQGGGGAGGAGAVTVSVEPGAPLDALPRSARLRITAGGAIDPATVALVTGEVGPVQLRHIAQQDPSSALQERIVPALVWRDGEAVVLAPSTLLAPGERYTLAVGSLLERIELRTAATDAAPVLSRTWPPAGSVSREPFAVWCGEGALPAIDVPVRLQPNGPAGHLRRGAVPSGAGQRCVRFEAAPGAKGEGTSWLAPPAVASLDGAVVMGLEPALLATGAAPSAMPSLACETGEIAFGPGCARIADDRLFGRSPEAPLLWAVAGAGADAAIAVGAGDPFTIAGLPPSTDVILDISAVDERGTRLRMLTSAVTASPMPHLILNEVLANPLGPEPASEWVEIVNDGPLAAELEGHVLADGGGETPLPKATLAPGAFALIVNEAFVEDDGIDPVPQTGVLILRVPHLGKNGLANAGELITLKDPTGSVLSRFPAVPKPKAGMSLTRRAPSAPDAVASSFVLAAPTPGGPNAW